MWKCPKCETLNNGDKCAVCGEVNPALNTTPVTPLTPVVPVAAPAAPIAAPEEKAKKSNGMVIALGIAAVVVILALIGVILVMALNNGKDNNQNAEVVTEVKEAEVVTEAVVSDDAEDIEPVQPDVDDNEPLIKEPADETEYVIGRTLRNIYENEMLGIGIEIIDSWDFADADQIAQENGWAEAVLGEELVEMMDSSRTIIVMKAGDNVGNNVNVGVQEMPFSMDMGAYATLMETQLPAMFAEVESIESITAEAGEVVIDGETFHVINTEMTMFSITMHQTMVLVDGDGYMGMITFTAFDKDDIAEYIDMMYLID